MPTNERTLDEVLRAAVDVLRENRIDHVFVGGVTVLAFGVVRTTADVDVIAALPADRIPKVVEGFRRHGFLASPQDMHDALVEGGHCTIQDSRSEYRIDLVPASTTDHREALGTKRTVSWRGLRLPMAAPEHTIVIKLLWGSQQDEEDAMAIYMRQKAKLDLEGMRAFARRKGAARQLADLEARAENLSPP